jgi:hypothetical protein
MPHTPEPTPGPEVANPDRTKVAEAAPTLTEGPEAGRLLAEQLRPVLHEEVGAVAGAIGRNAVRRYREQAGLYGAAGALGLYGGGALAVAIGLALALAVPGWAAALVVAVLLFAASAGLARTARERRKSL